MGFGRIGEEHHNFHSGLLHAIHIIYLLYICVLNRTFLLRFRKMFGLLGFIFDILDIVKGGFFSSLLLQLFVCLGGMAETWAWGLYRSFHTCSLCGL